LVSPALKSRICKARTLLGHFRKTLTLHATVHLCLWIKTGDQPTVSLDTISYCHANLLHCSDIGRLAFQNAENRRYRMNAITSRRIEDVANRL
jgi:hypothetical protein